MNDITGTEVMGTSSIESVFQSVGWVSGISPALEDIRDVSEISADI